MNSLHKNQQNCGISFNALESPNLFKAKAKRAPDRNFADITCAEKALPTSSTNFMTNAFVTRFLTANAMFSGSLRSMRDLYASSCKRNVLRWVLSPKVPLYQREDKDRNVSALYFHFQKQHAANISEGKWANKKFVPFFFFLNGLIDRSSYVPYIDISPKSTNLGHFRAQNMTFVGEWKAC